MIDDPVVAAAFAAHGRDMPRHGDAEEDGSLWAHGLPRVAWHDGFSRIDATVTWQGGVRYATDEEGGILTRTDPGIIPEIVLTGMTGRPLSEIVDVPGADGMRITCAVMSAPFAGEPPDLRIAVEPINARSET